MGNYVGSSEWVLRQKKMVPEVDGPMMHERFKADISEGKEDSGATGRGFRGPHGDSRLVTALISPWGGVCCAATANISSINTNGVK